MTEDSREGGRNRSILLYGGLVLAGAMSAVVMLRSTEGVQDDSFVVRRRAPRAHGRVSAIQRGMVDYSLGWPGARRELGR